MILLLSAVAQAACPLPPARIPELDRAAREYLFAEDLDGYAALWDTVLADLPCLEEPIDPAAFGSLLQGRALWLYAAEGSASSSWKDALTTALHAWPALPRTQGAPAFRAFEAPQEPPPGEPLPADTPSWLDGRPITAVPTGLVGVHLAQRRTAAGVFQTVVLVDGRWPWTDAEGEPPPPKPPRPAAGGAWAFAALGGGAGVAGQSVGGGSAGGPVSNDRGAGPVAAVASLGQVGGRVVGGWSGAVALQAGAGPTVDAFALAGVTAGPVTVLLGGGAVTAAVELSGSRSLRPLPQPHLAARLDVGPARLSLGGGASPAAFHASARVGLDAGKLGLLLGVDSVSARFDEVGGERTLTHGRVLGFLGVGGAFGAP